jgi:hypothetical protein
MNFATNNTMTVWLPFNTNLQIFTKVFAAWNQQVQFNDPNGLLNNLSWEGAGTEPNQTNIHNFTTPASYGQLLSYPVNVVISNDGGSNKANWQPSYVMDQGNTIVWSFDQVNNGGNVNLIVIFNKW